MIVSDSNKDRKPPINVLKYPAAAGKRLRACFSFVRSQDDEGRNLLRASVAPFTLASKPSH